MPFFDGLKQIKPTEVDAAYGRVEPANKKTPEELRKDNANLRSHISVLRKRNNQLREQLKAVQKAARELAALCSCGRVMVDGDGET